MVETRHILPPETGPASDPLLFGVAEALACLFPIDERHFPRPGPARAPGPAAGSEPAAGAAGAAAAAEPEIETA